MYFSLLLFLSFAKLFTVEQLSTKQIEGNAE